jgi:HlyD family secretion protein
MTNDSELPRKSRLAGIVGTLVLLGVLAFIGWGLWLAYHPVPVPLQGQVEARTINISPKISARIATMPVREGQAVAAGAVLITLDSPEVRAKLAQAGALQAAADARRDLVDVGARAEDIRAAKAMWDKATGGAELADKTYQRLNALYKEGLVSLQRKDEAQTNYKAALDTALAAKAQYDTALSGARPQEKRAAGAAALQAAGGLAEVEAAAQELVLKAPRAAMVDKVVLHAGELAGAGFPILTLVDLSDIWVVFNIREDDFAGINIGAVLKGSVPALGNKSGRFVIETISPRGDYATWRATRQSSGYDVRTFEVRARPQTPIEGLRPGMSVLVEAR